MYYIILHDCIALSRTRLHKFPSPDHLRNLHLTEAVWGIWIINKSFPWLDANSQQAKDIEKFRWFSNGYLGVDKKNRYVIYDVRFSTIPNQVEGLWGIKLDENKKDSEHVEYVTNRKRNLDRFNILINMVSGTHENWKIY